MRLPEGQPMILAGTGHRPSKLGGYGDHVEHRLLQLARDELSILKPAKIISGMALGWDQALAQAAIDLNIPFDAYVPFVGQELTWPINTRTRYNLLCRAAANVIITSAGLYAPWKMLVRNERMVDASDHVLAIWDGTSGGTAHCIRYATLKRKPVTNCWSRWSILP